MRNVSTRRGRFLSDANAASGSVHQVIGFLGFRGAPSVMEVAHTHTDLELNYVLCGSITYFIAGGQRHFAAGGTVLFWAGMPHRLIAAEPGSEFMLVTVPLAWFMQLGLPRAFAERLLDGEVVEADPNDLVAARTDRILFERWVYELIGGDNEQRRTVMLEVEARLRRLAAVSAPADRHETDASSRQLERIAQFVSGNYRSRLSVAEIGRAVSLHPNYLMALFKRSCGMSLWEYVIRLRVSHAQRLLVMSDLSVEEIASQSGFGSTASFYRAFQRICECTPRAYRLV